MRKILELGSGTGGNFPLLSQFGQVTAVEMNETARAISAGSAQGERKFWKAPADDLPLDWSKNST